MPPLHQAILHFPHLGPATAARLARLGIATWEDFLAPDKQAALDNFTYAEQWRQTARQNLDAASRHDNLFFIDKLIPADRWRLLCENWQDCCYLDIETDGLSRDCQITVISCWNGHDLRLFVNGENLDDFPDYLLTIPFLVTFNGSTFDLPIIRNAFNLPDLPVPHVDMRWVCHRCSLTGGLKPIEKQLGIRRPPDVVGTDGNDAVILWRLWQRQHRADARALLLRYCAADTIALQHVTATLLVQQSEQPTLFQLRPDDHWQTLNLTVPPPDDTSIRHTLAENQPETIRPRQTTPLRNMTAPLQPPATTDNTENLHASAIRERLRAFLDRKRSGNHTADA